MSELTSVKTINLPDNDTQTIYRFGNGYGALVTSRQGSGYTEITVLHWDRDGFDLAKRSDPAAAVVEHLTCGMTVGVTDEQVADLMADIAALDEVRP